MRVLMSAGFYDTAGFSTVMEQLANKLVEKGHDVIIGALWFRRLPSKGAFRVDTIPVGNALKLGNFLKEFDVIHNHHPLTNYLALLTNKSFIYHYHGAPEFGRGCLYRSSMLSSIKITSYRFDAVIAVSDAGRNEFEQYFNLKNVYVIYNGVDTNLFRPKLEERYRRGTPQFLFVGNLYAHKMVGELVLAFKKLVKTYRRAHLDIVGGGHTYGKLRSLVAELGLSDRVKLAGCVPFSDLPNYYASCDVYVTASRNELCPVPLLEAMACGKPIVASSIPPHVDLLTKSKAGTTYTKGDIENLCNKIINTYNERDKYESNALQFAKEHDWSRVAEKVLKIYSRLVRVY